MIRKINFIFAKYNEDRLEKDINEWLENNLDYSLINVQVLEEATSTRYGRAIAFFKDNIIEANRSA